MKGGNEMTPKETQQTAIEILKTLTEQIADNDGTHGELLGTVIKMLSGRRKEAPRIGGLYRRWIAVNQ